MAATAERPPLTRLADYLDTRGLSRAWLAERLGISESYLSLLLAGKRDYRDRLDQIAHVLSVPTWVVAPDISTPASFGNTIPPSDAECTPANLERKENHERLHRNTGATPGRSADGHRDSDSRATFPRPRSPSARRQMEGPGQRVRTSRRTALSTADARD